MRFQTSNRKMLVDTIKVLYLSQTNNLKNLPIFGVKASNLVIFEKTDYDIKKGIMSRMPGQETRLKDEDLIKLKQETIRNDIPELDCEDDSLTNIHQTSTAQHQNRIRPVQDEKWESIETPKSKYNSDSDYEPIEVYVHDDDELTEINA